MDKKRTTSSFRAMSTERKLESIFLFVTGRCNAKCAMCFYAQEMDKKQPDLTFDESRRYQKPPGNSIDYGYPGVSLPCVRIYRKYWSYSTKTTISKM